MSYEIKSFPFEVKADSKDDTTFEGYASVFGNVDSHGDIVEAGAFKKTLKENLARIKMLWQHDPWQPIGKYPHMEEDSKGLYVRGKVSDTMLGKDVITLIKDQVITELSIGYNVVKDLWDRESNLRKLQEVKLWEVSPVTFASNDLATITGAKSNELQSYLYNLNHELKAGRMISEKNIGLIKDAISALQTLLSKAEPEETEEEKQAREIAEILKKLRESA